MKCPICGKAVELQKKQIGVNDKGEPIFNEYAICRSCKKQWNLDKQRAKKAAAKKAAATMSQGKTSNERSAAQKVPEKKTVSGNTQVASQKSRATEQPGAKNENVQEQRYGNIPSEKVRTKSERTVRKNYEDMLAADPKHRPVKKRTSDSQESSVRKNTAPKSPQAARRRSEPVSSRTDQNIYEEDTPRFRPVKIILGLLSLVIFAFFTYRAITTGLRGETEGGSVGMTYIILALCMLVSALLLFILQKKNTVLAFLLPALLCIGSAVLAFLRRGDDAFLLYSAAGSAVFAILFIIFSIASLGSGDRYEDEYDDPFEEDHDNY